VRDLDHALDDRDLLGLEIDIAPAESKYFTPTHA
jgi:hypothetical protein